MSHQALSDLYPIIKRGEKAMENVSLANQFDEFIQKPKFASNGDDARLLDEFKRMIREDPRVPTWVLSKIARVYANVKRGSSPTNMG